MFNPEKKYGQYIISNGLTNLRVLMDAIETAAGEVIPYNYKHEVMVFRGCMMTGDGVAPIGAHAPDVIPGNRYIWMYLPPEYEVELMSKGWFHPVQIEGMSFRYVDVTGAD